MTATVSTVVVGGLVAGALIGSSASSPAMALAPIGHWVFNGAQSTALHVDPGTGRVDASVPAPQVGDASMVVQGPEAGYLVSPSKVTVFGKSTLTVDATFPIDGGADLPTPIETVGGPYLVYRTTGVVVRLGVPPASIQSGGGLTRPTYTDEGVVWIERADSGDVCSIAAKQDSTSCVTKADPARPHALTVVDGVAGVVDLAGGTFTPVTGGGTRSVGRPLPPDAKVADRTTSDGMLPVVLPSGTPELLLLPVGKNATRGATSTPLPPGTYDEPLATDTSATVVDSRSGTLRSFGSDGAQRGQQASPAAIGGLLHRGADGDAYMDGKNGAKAFVVRGATGEISAVDTTLAAAKDAAGAVPDPSVVSLGAPSGSSIGPPLGPPSPGGGGGVDSGRDSESSSTGGASGGSDKGSTDTDGPPPPPPPPPPPEEPVTKLTATALGRSEAGNYSVVRLTWNGDPSGTYQMGGMAGSEQVTGNSLEVKVPEACDVYSFSVKGVGNTKGQASATSKPKTDCEPLPISPGITKKGDRTYAIQAKYTGSVYGMECTVTVGGKTLHSGSCESMPRPMTFTADEWDRTYQVVITCSNKNGSKTGTGTIKVGPDPDAALVGSDQAELPVDDEAGAAAGTTTPPTTTTTSKKPAKTTGNGG